MLSLLLLVPALVLGTGHAVFVGADEAARMHAAGATVLDAREKGDYQKAHIADAVRIDWKDFRDGWGRTGRLDDDDRRLASRLEALGVSDGRPVLVYGAARSGWGEEGRIDWMLEYLGHREVHILDGGFAAWSAAHLPVESGDARIPRRGHLSPHRQSALRADLLTTTQALSDGKSVVLDVRTDAEWNGATPYWEPRGGHLPAARHLTWTDLLDGQGRLLPDAELRRRLAAVGVTPDKRVLLYCTGGVRSAFAWAVLRRLEFGDVRNFDASYYEWARHQELPVTVGGPR